MTDKLNALDEQLLSQAIDISRQALQEHGKTPFGALVAVGGEVVATGTSSVVELCDPTAHAEVMAIRQAATALGRHLMPDAVMYASSEPCPLCLAACYWARIPRLVFGATSYDVATYGFEDLQIYRELSLPIGDRVLTEQPAGETMRESAAQVLRAWADGLPDPVVPKY
ncbi:nucleoside deaminase [Micromonospora sp. Llam7]|uniref:nucleoside deaminase n=1 Tax=Micromonospora tarapacensis TaxID=2835305 RepID=UPI001C829BFD|nr:nucleoside deaminase [Micromonospora tarapacensis]